MITGDTFPDEFLQQTAAELTLAINDILPPPNKCQHEFFEQSNNRFKHSFSQELSAV